MAEMKVAKATQTEISNLQGMLRELSALGNYFSHQNPEKAIRENTEDFPTLAKIVGQDKEELFDNLCAWFANNRWEVVLFNLIVLMDNCADPKADTLEFNKRIQKGLALLGEQEAETSKA